MTVTMADVARAAGVSVATVSRALSTDAALVREETRRQVLWTAERLGYLPNHVARSMRTGSSHVVGLVVADIENPFFASVFRGVEQVAIRHGMSVALFNTDEDPSRERICLQAIAAERSAGVIVASTNACDPELLAIRDLGIPVVAIDRRVSAFECDSVLVDNEAAAFDATTHLIGLGHRRIAMLSGPNSASTASEREEGYRRAIAAAGLEPDERLVERGDFREETACTLARQLLDRVEPTAFFAVNNLTTFGVLRAAREARLRVPMDISIVGFDDPNVGRLVEPPLTAIAQPTWDLGRAAADLLFRRQAGPESPPAHVQLAADLIVRGSTSRARSR